RRHVFGSLDDPGARAVRIAVEFHVAAERNPGEAPARPLAVRVGGDLGTEADREGVDLHAAPAADQEVPEFVEENHDRENEDEGRQIAEQAPDILKKLHSTLPAFPTRGAAA